MELTCRCVQYFDGIATFEEIAFRTGLHRRELDHILRIFSDDVRVLFMLLDMLPNAYAYATDYDVSPPIMLCYC